MCAWQSTLALPLGGCQRAFPHHAIRRWAQIWATGTVYKETEASQHGPLQCLQHPAPHVRCADSCSGGLGSPPSFILKWELKTTPSSLPSRQEGSLHVEVPCHDPEGAVSWRHRCPPPPAQGTSAPRATCKPETSLHCCLLISRNGSIPPGPLKNLPYHLSAVSGSSAPGKKRICSWESGSPERRRQPAPRSIQPLPFPAASSAGAPPPGAWAWCRAG